MTVLIVNSLTLIYVLIAIDHLKLRRRLVDR